MFLLARLPGELGWMSSAARELKPKACSRRVRAQELYWWDVPVWRQHWERGTSCDKDPYGWGRRRCCS